MSGHYGTRRADVKPCGTAAAYRRHLRREGKPVRCRTCLQAEARRVADRGRDRRNALRRERYAALREAGYGYRDANRLSGASAALYAEALAASQRQYREAA